MTAKHVAGLAAGAGVLSYLISPETTSTFLSSAVQHDATKFGIAFTMAAFWHSKRVAAEIKLNFTGLIDALNNLGDALRKELKVHSDQLTVHANKLDKLQTDVRQLGTQVEAIQKQGEQK